MTVTYKTWSAGETVTAAAMNPELRDALGLLKTNIDDLGALRTALALFAFSAGQGNGAGSVDTQLTSYNVTIPANHLAQPGAALVVEGTWVVINSAGIKTGKLQVGGGTVLTISAIAGGSAQIVPFRMMVRRRASATGRLTGVSWIGAPSGGAPTNYMVDVGLGAVDWTVSQTLAIFANSAVANDLKLADYSVKNMRAVTGALV